MNGQNLTKFCIHIIIDKIYVGIVNRHFHKFATELRPLIDVRIQFVFNILRTNRLILRPNFVYTLSLTRSMFDCKSSFFANF